MKPCDTYQESLWLDAHGELAPEARIDLAGHLASCPGCRHEQRALRHLIQQAAAVHPPPALTAAESARLTENILSVLEAKHVRTAWRPAVIFQTVAGVGPHGGRGLHDRCRHPWPAGRLPGRLPGLIGERTSPPSRPPPSPTRKSGSSSRTWRSSRTSTCWRSWTTSRSWSG